MRGPIGCLPQGIQQGRAGVGEQWGEEGGLVGGGVGAKSKMSIPLETVNIEISDFARFQSTRKIGKARFPKIQRSGQG